MSLLWSGEKKTNPLTNFQKPSPTYQSNLPDSARNPESFLDAGKRRASILSRFIEGSSLFTSLSKIFFRELNAGMTVEAAIVLPLFLFFFLNLGSAMEMIRLHGNLQLALWQVGSKLSLYSYVVDSGDLQGDNARETERQLLEYMAQENMAQENGKGLPESVALGNGEGMPENDSQGNSWWKDLVGVAFASTFVKAQIVDSAGEEYLDHSPLTNGVDSLWLWESKILGQEDEIDIIVTYSVSPWSSLAGFPSFRMANRYYAHAWNGYRLPGTEEAAQTVFITENASVYHVDRNCSHLKLSVRQIPATGLEEARNQSGGRYQSCEKCVKGEKVTVLYITDDGDRFHYSRTCSGLKRTVYSVTLEEAKKYRICSRCGEAADK